MSRLECICPIHFLLTITPCKQYFHTPHAALDTLSSFTSCFIDFDFSDFSILNLIVINFHPQQLRSSTVAASPYHARHNGHTPCIPIVPSETQWFYTDQFNACVRSFCARLAVFVQRMHVLSHPLQLILCIFSFLATVATTVVSSTKIGHRFHGGGVL